MRRRWVAAAVALGAALVLTVPPGPSGAEAGDLCERFSAPTVSGTIAEPRVMELSGLVGSRQWSDVLWGHNDSGGAPELYAFAEDGTSLGSYPLAGAQAIDWEDMAAGPDETGTTDVLYVGDIGDNDAVRPTVTVYRVHEPGEIPGSAPAGPLTEVDAIELRYPDGPSDAEALLIDPRTGDLVIVTKSVLGASRILTAEASALVEGPPVELIDAGALDVPLPPRPGSGFPGTMVTGGDVSPDGSIVLLRTYRSVLAFERGERQSLAEALLGEPCFAPQAEEEQGETVAFTGDGSAYVTASEGAHVAIHRVGIVAAATTTTTTSAPAPDVPPARRAAAADDDDSGIAAVLVVTGLVLLLAGAGAVLWSRRRRSAG